MNKRITKEEKKKNRRTKEEYFEAYTPVENKNIELQLEFPGFSKIKSLIPNRQIR